MSQNKILTTHTGSLPRPDDLIQMMWAKGDGIPVDKAVLDERIASAVDEIVAKQLHAGIDVVNDGEMSKPSYATYVKDRLSGFGGESPENYFFADLADYPGSNEIVAANPGRRKRSAPACNAEIGIFDPKAAEIDMVNLQGSAQKLNAPSMFSSSASPGVISLFFHNDFYKSDEDYLFAIAEAMRHEYEAIAATGAYVQLDCPDLAMGRHTEYAKMDDMDFRKRAALNISALNHAVRNIPAEQLRMHLCWGNYPGPHHCDINIAEILDLVWEAKPQTILFEAANPRHAHEWEVFKTHKLPDEKIICPGVIEPQSNFIEHPELVAQRIERYANLVGKERVMAGVDCGFSVHVGMQGIDPEVAFAKLRSLADGAAIASEKLWS
ncbi:MAG: cobalamin-independent methionine synthase II family protein [Gammaproteobacteria bacterium]|jgi:5-methyltetrahydropteroyltriglutamate--homocysteine methyltransferase|nr:cobalamin-independent methionine synthase II family protein [Gammaproteobacteria bacterium]